jgi:hypothetical protein
MVREGGLNKLGPFSIKSQFDMRKGKRVVGGLREM